MNIRAYAHLVPLVPYVMIGVGLLFVAPDELVLAAILLFLVGVSRKNIAKTQGQTQDCSTDKQCHVGVIAALGRDYYRFDHNNSQSFFIQLRDDKGRESILWGIDLQRLVEKEHLVTGDHVQLDFLGKQPVEVVRKVRNANGDVVGTEKIQAHRNRWSAKRLPNS